MRYLCEDWLIDLMRGDSAFLRKVGIKPCPLDDPRPEPLPVPLPRERRCRLTKKDTEWLKESGVAWEPEPAFQFALDFSGDDGKAALTLGGTMLKIEAAKGRAR